MSQITNLTTPSNNINNIINFNNDEMICKVKRDEEAPYRSDDIISIPKTQLFALREGGHLCDIVVKVRDSDNVTVDFAAHKVILVAASPFFQYLYDNGQLSDQIDLPSSFGPTAFSILLDAMYGKPLTVDDLRARTGTRLASLVDDLKSLASFLMLISATKRLERWLSREDGFLLSSNNLLVDLKEEDMRDGIKEEGTEVDMAEFAREPEKRTKSSQTEDDVGSRRLTVDVVRIDVGTAGKYFTRNSSNGPPLDSGDDDVEEPESGPRSPQLGASDYSKRKRFASREKTSKRKEVRSPPVATRKKGKRSVVASFEESENVVTSLEERSVEQLPPTKSDEEDPNYVGSNVKPVNSLDDGDRSQVSPEVPESKFKALTPDEIKGLFKNPRDQVMIGKKRLLNKVDSVRGSVDSWHAASDEDESLIGKMIPYGNRNKRTNKIWNDTKRIAGKICGTSIGAALRLTLADGEIREEIRCKWAYQRVWCPFCKLKISRSAKSQLNEHMAMHFLNDHDYVWIDFALVCDLCGFITFSLENVKDHLGHFHGISRRDHPGALCPLCGKAFESNKRLQVHKAMCAGNDVVKGKDESPKKVYPQKLVICGTCGKTCQTVLILENHMSKEHGVPYRYQCHREGCSFGVNARFYLEDHLFSAHKVNVGTRPILKCSHCDYYTLRKNVLAKHELIHTSVEYSFKCTHDGCDKSFRQKRHLKKHADNAHTNLKLPCQFCNSVFTTKIKLRRHEKVMHTQRVRNFKCAYCSHATVSRENCCTHIKNSHKGRPVTVIDLKKSGLPPIPV